MKRLLLVVAMLASCSDPLHDKQVDALGPETGGGPGPTHRPGQPCLTCHGGEGPSKTEFAVAGTVYQTPDLASPAANNAQVTIIDAPQPIGAPLDNTHTITVVTNTAGNFYIPKGQYSPVYPLRVQVTTDGLKEPTVMTTHIGRNGGCGTCHFDPKGPKTPGHVYLVADPADLPGGGGGP